MKVKILEDLIISYGPQKLNKDEIIDLPTAVVSQLLNAKQAELVMPESKSSKKKEKKT